MCENSKSQPGASVYLGKMVFYEIEVAKTKKTLYFYEQTYHCEACESIMDRNHFAGLKISIDNHPIGSMPCRSLSYSLSIVFRENFQITGTD